jgi:hypothetical protein
MTKLWTAILLSASLAAASLGACKSSSDGATDTGAGGAGGSGGAGGAAGGAGGSGGTTSAGGHGGHWIKKDAGATHDAEADAPAPEPPNSVHVHVAYAGAKHGTLHIDLWKGATYVGGPDSSKVDDFPTFPYDVQIQSVIAGTYTLTAYLDVGMDSPDKPGEGDPAVVYGTPVDVTDAVGADVEITLADP